MTEDRILSDVDFEDWLGFLRHQGSPDSQKAGAAIHADRQARISREAELVAALKEQWEINHTEHCSRSWPHPVGKDCYWPLPAVLERAKEVEVAT